jgi:hypothetical protein
MPAPRRSTMRSSQWTSGVVGAALFVSCLGAAVPAWTVSYALYPTVANVAPAQLCTLSVVADTPGDSLGCVECWVTWDAARVTLVSGQEGALFKNAGVGRLFFNHAVAADTFSVEGCLLGYRTYLLTPGQVARFIFRGDQAGVSPVSIVRFNLWDIDRTAFEPEFDPNAWIVVGSPTGVAPRSAGRLDVRAHPNPFNPSTTIELRAQAGAHVRMDIYSAAGRRVRRLFDGRMQQDVARFLWDGNDDNGSRLPSGVYFATALGEESSTTRKVVLIK